MDTLAYYVTHPTAIIYLTATALLYPVVIAELLLLVFSVFEAGRFTVEIIGRWRKRSLATLRNSATLARDAVTQGKPEEAIEALGAALKHTRYGQRFVQMMKAEDLERHHLLKLLSEVEGLAARRLERTRMLVRFGPILGLMGTLIPISPALVGLAQGDVQTLSDNLVIAFSTTVVGLLIGGIGYAISTVRERTYTRDMDDIEYALEIVGL
ncbi:MAG: MotA/TolQ/ExbB proton channel family protein [Coriobacteriia bacterium]|nr:MotA/TolQ/ExbB proton channel family protein [Coriobacteriia bacterium]